MGLDIDRASVKRLREVPVESSCAWSGPPGLPSSMVVLCYHIAGSLWEWLGGVAVDKLLANTN